MVKLIIFDFDGVIVDGTNEGYFTCYHNALTEAGIHLDPEEENERIHAKWGKGHKIQLEYLLKEHPHLIPEAIKAYEVCYHSPVFQDKIHLIPGADDAVKRLAKKYTLAIATGMQRPTLDALLTKYGIAFCFTATISVDDVDDPEKRKPSPYMLEQLMNQFDVSTTDTVAIGDAASDVTMARNAKVTPLVVLTGNLTREKAESLDVQYIFPDVTAVERILQSF